MKKIRIKGIGDRCPKCSNEMERREHTSRPKTEYFYTEWDYCKNCKHVQHYEKYKSLLWQEIENHETILNRLF